MLITQRRIRSIRRHFRGVREGQAFALGVREVGRFNEQLVHAGFDLPLTQGATLLPAPVFGPVSRYNAEGKFIVHRDQPMETAYKMVQWTWKEWRGRDRTEEMTDFRDVPYQRYPRTFVVPPSVELTIAEDRHGELLVVTPGFEHVAEQHESIIHAVNLYLEMFRECEVFTEDLQPLALPRLRRVNWEILPPGRYPWHRLQVHIQPIVDQAPGGNRPVIENRFQTINSYNPEFHAIGRAGFRGYVVFGFPDKNLYVLESVFTGNATYVFDEDWEELSRLTKAQVLDEQLQEDRIIHRRGWHDRVEQLLA